MNTLRGFWSSATTRSIAVVSVIGLFVVYLLRTWRRAGAHKLAHAERESVLKEYEEQRLELKNKTVDDVNKFERAFHAKITEIDTREKDIKAKASESRAKLADALNKSFGR